MNKNKNADLGFENFSWLVGSWTGEAFGGTFEEIWLPASGGSMAGTFKLIVDDKVKFYELMIIRFIDNKPLLSLKHFDSDLVGWEDKEKVINFEYIGWQTDELKFDGLAYRRVSDTSMVISLAIKDPKGNINEDEIVCTRISRR